jgi:formylglycine-generating enzyme required for sulfatase activity
MAISGVALEPNGFGAIFATAADVDDHAPLRKLLSEMAALRARGTLASFDGTWRALPQRRVLTPPPPERAVAIVPPAGALAIPAGDFLFRVQGAEIEGDDAHGVDVQFEWEETPRKEHEKNVSVGGFHLDREPVSCGRYASYLRESGYRPDDRRGWLRHWPDADRGVYPRGNRSVPVTGVSLAEAKHFCEWVGGRLPTGIEWQYAAQGGDSRRTYPWGATDDQRRRPPVASGRETPSPFDSSAFSPAGDSPFGVADLVGNVWQYTADEFEDGHTRFVLLRGGARYTLTSHSKWYFPSAGFRLDRHTKYLLMDDAFERAATLGFRCAYDARRIPTNAAPSLRERAPAAASS